MFWKKRDNCSTIEEVVARNLGINKIEDIQEWEKKYEDDAYYIRGIDEVCDIIREKSDTHIRICGDYDVDGRMASMILFLALRRIGCRDVMVRIPRRFSEGYGMSTKMIDEIKDDDSLVITVDNGITAFEAVAAAKQRGMTVIVTDHHLPKKDENDVDTLPDADIIIDPNAIKNSAMFNGYCGAGVAYKIAKRLLDGDSFIETLLPYAAIATVADVMELKEENYVLVKKGMEMISNREASPGLLALLNKLHVEVCTATTVGFKIAPTINAPGRMEDIDKVTLPLLACSKMDQAYDLADKMIAINQKRQEAVAYGEALAEKILKEEGYTKGIIIVNCKGCRSGILGIIAGRLSDKYCVPAIVLSGDEGSPVIHGSARSVEGFNIVQLFSEHSGEFESFGGHAQAAGLSVRTDKFRHMKETLEKAFEESGFVYTPPEDAFFDLEISEKEVAATATALEKFEPFGTGNSKPVFLVKGFRTIERPREIKGGGAKIRGVGIEAIGFGMFDKIASTGLDVGTYDIYGTIGWNVFNGRRTPQIEIIDIERVDKRVETDFAKTIRAIK